jgi:hypothetical protein
MKTAFGMKHRPEFEVIDWKQWGGDGAIAGPRAPQLSAPAPASMSKTTAEQTITGMGTIKPVPPKEFVDDEIPW